jgi:hypothetical protein
LYRKTINFRLIYLNILEKLFHIMQLESQLTKKIPSLCKKMLTVKRGQVYTTDRSNLLTTFKGEQDMSAKIKRIASTVCLSIALTAAVHSAAPGTRADHGSVNDLRPSIALATAIHSAALGPEQIAAERTAFNRVWGSTIEQGTWGTIRLYPADTVQAFVKDEQAWNTLQMWIDAQRIQNYAAAFDYEGRVARVAAPFCHGEGLTPKGMRDLPDNPVREVLCRADELMGRGARKKPRMRRAAYSRPYLFLVLKEQRPPYNVGCQGIRH